MPPPPKDEVLRVREGKKTFREKCRYPGRTRPVLWSNTCEHVSHMSCVWAHETWTDEAAKRENMNKDNTSENDNARAEPEAKEYLVEKVVDHRFNRQGLPEFFVCWKGFARKYDSWEPLTNVLGNHQFVDYWETLDEETRKHIRVPGNAPIGSDQDGLCVRRAIERLHLPGVDLQKFGPSMQLDQVIATLREEDCIVRKLRKRQRVDKKKLLCIKGAHAYGFDVKNGNSSIRNKFQVIYVVTKRTQMRHAQR